MRTFRSRDPLGWNLIEVKYAGNEVNDIILAYFVA